MHPESDRTEKKLNRKYAIRYKAKFISEKFDPDEEELTIKIPIKGVKKICAKSL